MAGYSTRPSASHMYYRRRDLGVRGMVEDGTIAVSSLDRLPERSLHADREFALALRRISSRGREIPGSSLSARRYPLGWSAEAIRDTIAVRHRSRGGRRGRREDVVGRVFGGTVNGDRPVPPSVTRRVKRARMDRTKLPAAGESVVGRHSNNRRVSAGLRPRGSVRLGPWQ